MITNESPLFDAVFHKDLATLDALLASGADINAPLPGNAPGHTPLIVATITGDPDLVRAILDRGADVHGTDKLGSTALHLASNLASYPVRTESGENSIWENQIAIMGILIDAGADVNARCANGIRPVLTAAGCSNPRAVRFLVERGAWVQKDQDSPWSESSYLRHRRDVRQEALRENPDVRPWRKTLAVLNELAPKHGV